MHGEFRMLVQHGRLAIETGVQAENVFIIENGTPIEIFADGSARRGMPVPAGYVYVDGLSVGEVGDVVLRDRRALANDGMFMIVVQIDKQTGRVVGRPEIITRGFVHGNEDDPMIEEAVRRIRRGPRPPGDRICEVAMIKSPDQGQRVALPVRADEAAADGLPGRGRGLTRGHATLVPLAQHRHRHDPPALVRAQVAWRADAAQALAGAVADGRAVAGRDRAARAGRRDG